MTLLSGLLVGATVWAIGLIRSVRRRALAYSFPLPITLMLLTTPTRVDGRQLIGVLALTVFVAVVALAHRHWPILLADAAGAAAYLAIALPLAQLPPPPFWPTLATLTTAWAAATLALPPPPRRPPSPPPPTTRRGTAVKAGVVFGAAFLMTAMGRALQGFVVTFPYSGVLVVIEARAHLNAFARHFLRNSLALLAFFAAHHPLQPHSSALAMTAAWAAFLATITALQTADALRRDRIRLPF